MLTPFKLRVDTIDPDVVGHIAQHYSSDCYLYCSENVGADNPHSHLYLELSEKNKDQPALRTYIRKNVGSGNRCYSLVKLDEFKCVEYLAYVIKGGDYLVHNLCLVSAKDYDFNVKSDIKKKKKTPQTVLSDIEATFQYSGNISQYQIIENVIQYHKTKGTLIREFALVSLCQTLCLKYSEGYQHTLSFNISRTMDKTRL